MARIKTDSNLYGIEKRLDEVMDLCAKEHEEKIELKAENYDLKKQLDSAIQKLNRQINTLKTNDMSKSDDTANLTSSQRAWLEKTEDLRDDIMDFAKKIDSIAYSVDIKNRKQK